MLSGLRASFLMRVECTDKLKVDTGGKNESIIEVLRGVYRSEIQ